MSFLGQIKRRKIFQVAAVYAVVAWLLVQVIVSVEETLNLPGWADTIVIVCLAVVFPVTLIMSSGFNLTAQGLVKDQGKDAAVQSGGRRIEFVLIALLIVSMMWVIYRVEFDASETVTDASVPAAPVVETVSSAAFVHLCDFWSFKK